MMRMRMLSTHMHLLIPDDTRCEWPSNYDLTRSHQHLLSHIDVFPPRTAGRGVQ